MHPFWTLDSDTWLCNLYASSQDTTGHITRTGFWCVEIKDICGILTLSGVSKWPNDQSRFPSDQMTNNPVCGEYNLHISCSFSTYCLSYVDHHCLLVPETFDIRFARMLIKAKLQKSTKCSRQKKYISKLNVLSGWSRIRGNVNCWKGKNVIKLPGEDFRWDLLVCMRCWTLNKKKTKKNLNILGKFYPLAFTFTSI